MKWSLSFNKVWQEQRQNVKLTAGWKLAIGVNSLNALLEMLAQAFTARKGMTHSHICEYELYEMNRLDRQLQMYIMIQTNSYIFFIVK